MSEKRTADFYEPMTFNWDPRKAEIQRLAQEYLESAGSVKRHEEGDDDIDRHGDWWKGGPNDGNE